MGTLVTFYSYKGGVGRTMALANIATLLAIWGKKVLVVDWDLEAPGVEHFLVAPGADLNAAQKQRGLIDLLTELSEKTSPNCAEAAWRSLLIETRIPGTSAKVSLLTAGARTKGYFRSVRSLDVRSFYEDKNGGHIIESLRRGWKSKFDFVLVDSRTGITDIGGICTIQLPDILAIVFTATAQSLDGAVDVAKKAAAERQKLPFDRSLVPTVPIPGRFDTQTEHEISNEWLGRFETALAPFYHQWLPREVNRREFLKLTKIPYTPFFSFGEALPVVAQGTKDPAGLGYAYETVTALIGNNLEHAELLIANRDEFVQTARSSGRIPKVPLRESQWECVLLIGVGSGSLRVVSEQSGTKLKEQGEVLQRYHSTVGENSREEGGVLVESDGQSFLFAFPQPEKALRCALAIQESMAVKRPISGPSGVLTAR
jgi:MinD-like ATPase involved in chromosome partitioning or flagellar assembly